ncbi:MAG: hypothetical protein AAGI53_01845 [Planctomycetota bacterium]
MINPDLLATAANANQPYADTLQSRTAARLLKIIDEVDKLLVAANEVQRIRNETHALLKTIGWSH